MWIVYVILAALAILIAVVLLRAAAFRPREEESAAPEPVLFDRDRALDHLTRMVRIRTVSYLDTSKEDGAEFERFRALLPELYPRVFAACETERVGRTGIFLKLPGREAGAPSVFMAHYDVVPPDEDAWEHPPFCGEVIDGELWGRGTLDTKITLCGAIEALETLLEGGFVPKNEIILAFMGDEETNGASAQAAVALLKERGIVPAFVLDEGGAVVEGVFPGVTGSCALIGIAEKGLLNVDFTLEAAGGHASTPPPRSTIGRLADAVGEIERHPFPRKLTKPIAEMFDILGRRSTFVYRLIFSNLWLFMPVLDSMCKKSGGELNAMLRTTVAFTRMAGSDAYNVLPPRASVSANLRVISGETAESAVERLRRTAGDGDIVVSVQQGMDPSPVSDTDCDEWRQLKRAIAGAWPGALISPYLMLACSDSRYYSLICDKVYRFSAMNLSKEERGRIHGNNERIPVETVYRTVEFFIRMIAQR